MKAEIRSIYKVSNTNEISVDWHGNNYLIIYGKHINGWFIAIPNWGVATEAGDPSDVFYNMEKLARVIPGANDAKVLAEAIEAHWEWLNE